MIVLPVPARLDYRSVEALYENLAGVPATDSVMLDAHALRWIDPAGMAALLSAGTVAKERSGETPQIALPPARAEVTGYLERMRFPEAASKIFGLSGGRRRPPPAASDVLLEITPVTRLEDVHLVVERVRRRAGAILTRTLGYSPMAVVQFAVVLSEICQNIIEHAEGPGWVAAQCYAWTRRLGRRVGIIAVSDVGRGFRASIESAHQSRYGRAWSDAAALEATVREGLSRFPDEGRGQGLRHIRKQTDRWNGLVAIRSGTARIADGPAWSGVQPLDSGLSPFPGSQIVLVLPENLDRT